MFTFEWIDAGYRRCPGQKSFYFRKYPDTGLGLALTRKMVELHSGAIRAESAGQGQGSTFKFAIPLPAAIGKAPAAV